MDRYSTAYPLTPQPLNPKTLNPFGTPMDPSQGSQEQLRFELLSAMEPLCLLLPGVWLRGH